MKLLRPHWIRLLGICVTVSLPPYASPYAFADIKPKSVFGSGGAENINIYSKSYKTVTSTRPAMTLGLDIALNQRWSIAIRTLSTQDDSLGGTRLGFTAHFNTQKSILTPPNVDESSYTVSAIPNWSFDVSSGFGRWVLTQDLETTLPFVPENLKKVPVKAPIYGLYLGGLVEYHWSESWGFFGEYTFMYATGSQLNLIGHYLGLGARLWL